MRIENITEENVFQTISSMVNADFIRSYKNENGTISILNVNKVSENSFDIDFTTYENGELNLNECYLTSAPCTIVYLKKMIKSGNEILIFKEV